MRKNYQLDDYQKLLESLGLLKEACLFGKDQEKVTDLTFNSKEVTPGTLYICKGMNFKEAYLTEALEKGAVCYVSEIPYPNEQDVPHLLVSDIRKAMPYLADLCFEAPGKS